MCGFGRNLWGKYFNDAPRDWQKFITAARGWDEKCWNASRKFIVELKTVWRICFKLDIQQGAFLIHWCDSPTALLYEKRYFIAKLSAAHQWKLNSLCARACTVNTEWMLNKLQRDEQNTQGERESLLRRFFLRENLCFFFCSRSGTYSGNLCCLMEMPLWRKQLVECDYMWRQTTFNLK